MKNFLLKYINRETLSYLFFGVLTTIINYFAFWLVIQVWGPETSLIANVFAFILATAFAYITNKLYVFKSKSWHLTIIRKEIIAFLGTRICSFLFEELGLYFCSAVLRMDQWYFLGVNGIFVAKIGLSIIVVIINYILSKWVIFRRNQISEDR